MDIFFIVKIFGFYFNIFSYVFIIISIFYLLFSSLISDIFPYEFLNWSVQLINNISSYPFFLSNRIFYDITILILINSLIFLCGGPVARHGLITWPTDRPTDRPRTKLPCTKYDSTFYVSLQIFLVWVTLAPYIFGVYLPVAEYRLNFFFFIIADYPSQDGVYGKQDYGKYNSQYRKVHWFVQTWTRYRCNIAQKWKKEGIQKERKSSLKADWHESMCLIFWLMHIRIY